MNLIGPFKKSTNLSHDTVFIYMQIGNNMSVSEKFDITKASNNQNKPDTATFYFDIDIDKMTEEINVSLQITTNADDGVPFQLFIDTYSIDTQIGALCGGTILILLNVLIISEVKI